MKPTLIVIAGPTAVGKTDAAIEVARALRTEIISADSRQVYAGIPITTAAPTPAQLAAAPHHLVGTLPLEAPWSAALFEQEAMRRLPAIFERGEGRAVVCGGSSLYLDALCRGLHPVPDITEQTRQRVRVAYESEGLGALSEWLRRLDPEFHSAADLRNPRRVMHAIEICLQTGSTVSALRACPLEPRPFRVLKFMLTAPRPVLFGRINARVLQMAEDGMVEEARAHIARRGLQSLDTVGFHEMFRYLDGDWSLEFALARLQKNTRVYAKKQMTYLARDPGYIPVSSASEILSRLKSALRV